MVCPEVADVANPSKKTSPTGRAEVGRCCAVGAGSTSCSAWRDLSSSAVWAPLTIE